MFCTHCGAEVPDGARFCSTCGADLSGQSAPSAASSAFDQTTPRQSVSATSGQTMPQVTSHAAPQPVANPVSDQPVPTQVAPSSCRPRRTFKITAIALLALLVLIGGGVGVWFAFFAPYPISQETFPDSGVRTAVSAQLDLDGNGELSRDEASAATSLTVEDPAEVAGLGKYLPHLEQLTFFGFSSTRVDVTDLGALATLDISGAASITEVSVAGCGALESVIASTDAPLAELDVSGCGQLEELVVPDDTVVSGLDQTPLQELWLPESYRATSEDGTLDDRIDATRDATGVVTEYTDDNGTMSYRYLLERDDAGRVTAVESHNERYGYVMRDELTWEDERVTQVVSSTDGEYRGTTTYVYDEAGNLLESDREGVSTDIEDRTTSTYTYGEDGALLSEVTTNTMSNPRERNVTWEYADGLPVSLTIDQRGSTTGTTTAETRRFDYDDAGNITEVTCESYTSPAYDDDENHANLYKSVTYTYDDEGRIIGALSEALGREATFTYDEAGNLTQVVEKYGGTGSVTAEMTYRRYFVPEERAAIAQPLLQMVPKFQPVTSDEIRSLSAPMFVTCVIDDPLPEASNPLTDAA